MKRGAIIALWVALVVFGLLRLRLDVQVLNLLPPEVPAVRALQLYEKHFANADELIITLEGPDADELEQTSRALAHRLREASNLVARAQWQPPWNESPAETGDLLAHMWLNAAPEHVRDLAQRLSATNVPVALELLKEQLAVSFSPQDLLLQSYDPFGLSRVGTSGSALEQGATSRPSLFSSEEGDFRLLLVESRKSLASFPECRAWMAEMRQIVGGWIQTNSAATRVGFTGRPAFVSEISEGMENDMGGSIGGTALIIGILFWIAHRTIKPLLALLLALAAVLLTILALGGLLFGTLNVISLGFAAILLGLAEDYGVVLYQEHHAHPGASAWDVRRLAQRGIWWSAATTCGGFLLLNFAGLPGLGQLGTLVGLGSLAAAVIMLFMFLPMIVGKSTGATAVAPRLDRTISDTGAWWGTMIVLVSASAVLLTGLPRVDSSAEALRPRDTPAYETMEAVRTNALAQGESFWAIVQGRTQEEVATSLSKVQGIFDAAQESGLLEGYDLPTSVWPNPNHARENAPILAGLASEAPRIREQMSAAGLDDKAFALTARALGAWSNPAVGNVPERGSLIQWVLQRTMAQTDEGWLALGSVRPAATIGTQSDEWSILVSKVSEAGALVAGWDQLGRDLLLHVEKRIALVLVGMLILSVTCLWFAFGSWREILLSFASLLVSLWCLLAVMKLAGWSWNLMNLVALPLLIGAGLDYTIHVQLALRRNNGAIAAMRQTVGRALVLCAATTVAGFGSLGWAGSAGLASLGLVAAAGLALICFVSVYLLPAWWLRASPREG